MIYTYLPSLLGSPGCVILYGCIAYSHNLQSPSCLVSCICRLKPLESVALKRFFFQIFRLQALLFMLDVTTDNPTAEL